MWQRLKQERSQNHDLSSPKTFPGYVCEEKEVNIMLSLNHMLFYVMFVICMDYISCSRLDPSIELSPQCQSKNPCVYIYIHLWQLQCTRQMQLSTCARPRSAIMASEIRDPLVRTRHIRLNKLLVELRRLYGGMAFQIFNILVLLFYCMFPSSIFSLIPKKKQFVQPFPVGLKTAAR